MDALAPTGARLLRRELPSASLDSLRARLVGRRAMGALVVGGVLGAVLGGLAGAFAQKVYESSAQLAVIANEDPTQTGGNALEGASAALPMLTAVLQTGPAADAVIASLDLARVYRTASVVESRTAFWKRVSVTSDRRSGIVRITASDADPKRARDIALTLAQFAMGRMTQLWSAGPRSQREKLEARLAEISDSLAKAEQEMQRFRERTGGVDFDEQRRGALPSTGALPRLQVEHARRKRAIDENVAARDVFIRQIQQLRTAESKPLARIDLIEEPVESRIPTRPNRPALLAIGAIVCAGLAWIIQQMLARRRERQLAQVSAALPA